MYEDSQQRMAIYKSAIEKPVTTALIFVAVIVIGIYSFLKLPIDQVPEMDPPYITVMTTYPGASASEMETNVTKIMENALTSVDHLKHITSQSKDNISVVTLELEWGENMDEAADYIHATRSTLYKLTAAGEIAYHKSGKKNVFRIADLDRYLASRRKSSIEEIKEKANSRRS